MLRIKTSLLAPARVFKEDMSQRQSCLIFFAKENAPSAWSVDIGFLPAKFKCEEVSPSLCINPIDTDKTSAAELAGESFSVSSIEQSTEREDSFYIYEHEPLVRYTLKILDISDGRAHVTCSGTLVLDGSAEPFITAKFSIDSWIPVIGSPDDWDKLDM